MTTPPTTSSPLRDAILSQLALAQAPVSGARLADELGISRAAVWKHIHALQQKGVRIEAIGGKGYRLASDTFNAKALIQRLDKLIPNRLVGKRCVVLDETDSTNSVAMRMAMEEAAPEGTVIFAHRQTKGRGRLGRVWHTMPEAALAFSLILRPKLPPEHVTQLPLMAAVAVHHALQPLLPHLGIKWPNDLLCNGKKLAGILAEMRAEPGHIHAVVLGIGINIRAPESGWPADIAQPATDLCSESGKSVSRLDIAARLIASLDECYNELICNGFEGLRERWWNAHAFTNQQVRVLQGDGYIKGIAAALDSDGALLLETSKGLERVVAGDLEAGGGNT